MKLIKKLFSIPDEVIILTAAAAVMMPYIVVTVVINVLTAYVLIKPATRRKIFDMKITKYIIFSFPVFTVPSLLFKNWLGLAMGLWQWYVMFFGLFCLSVMSVKLFDKMLNIFMIMTVPAGIYAVIQFVTGDNPRVSSYFMNQNYYGFILEIIVLCGIYKLYKTKGAKYLFFIYFDIACMFLCDSRGAWGALAIASMFFAVVFARKMKWILVTAISIVAVVLITLYVPFLSSRLSSDSIMLGYGGRYEIWKAAAAWIVKRPLIGHGPMSMDIISGIIDPSGEFTCPHAHNIVINTLLDYGIIGTVFALLLCIKMFKTMIKYIGNNNDYKVIFYLFVVLTIAIAAHGMLDIPMMGSNTFLIPLMIISGSAVGYNERKQMMNKTCF